MVIVDILTLLDMSVGRREVEPTHRIIFFVDVPARSCRVELMEATCRWI